MAIAARQPFIESVQPGVAAPVPRLTDDSDLGGRNSVQDQQRALAAAFTARHAQPRFRAVILSLLTLASLGLWAALIAAIVQVGRMVQP